MSCNGGRRRATATNEAHPPHADPYANVQVRPVAADERSVNDSVDPASPRVAHDPVNDSGGTPAATTATTPPAIPAAAHAASNPDPAGFRFNLDDALARLSEPHHPIPRFNWSALSPTSTDALSPQGPMHTGPMAAGAQAAAAEPGVDALDVPRSGLASPPAHATDARSTARDPRGHPGRRRRHGALVNDPRGRPASGCARVAGPSGLRRSDDRVGHRRLRRRRQRIQPRLRLLPDSRRDAQPARRRRYAATARVRARCRAPDGNDDVGDGGSSDGEIGVGIDGPWSPEGQTSPPSQAGPGRAPPGRALRRSADVRP